MNDRTVLAKDKIGGCRYEVAIQGSLLTVTMRGYGLKATDTQKISRIKSGHFNYDAEKLKEKMVTLERRMRELARLTAVLQANHVTGVPHMTEAKAAKPAVKPAVKKAKGLTEFEKLLRKV